MSSAYSIQTLLEEIEKSTKNSPGVDVQQNEHNDEILRSRELDPELKNII
jgi:hypothetical protein